jgi:site-specific DNA recombinase
LVTPDTTALFKLSQAADNLFARLKKEPGDTTRELIARIDISPGALNITLNRDALAAALDVQPADLDRDAFLISTGFQLRKRGVETKIVSGKYHRAPDATLIRAIASAHGWLAEIRRGTSLAAIGRRHGWTDSPVRQRIKLAFLSPRITETILAGKQPPQLTLQKLLLGPIPFDWQTQWSELGFEEAVQMQAAP